MQKYWDATQTFQTEPPFEQVKIKMWNKVEQENCLAGRHKEKTKKNKKKRNKLKNFSHTQGRTWLKICFCFNLFLPELNKSVFDDET